MRSSTSMSRQTKRSAIAYRVRDGLVEITNIFHGGRDYEALYRNASGE